MEMISRLKKVEMQVFCMPSRMIWREYSKNSDSVYIDSYWLGGDESDVYHYVLGKGSVLHQRLDILFRMNGCQKTLSIFIIV